MTCSDGLPAAWATATADDLINHPSSNDNERVDFLHAASSHFLQYERREMT